MFPFFRSPFYALGILPVLILCSVAFSRADTTRKFPVTFYDFHGDGSNPEMVLEPNNSIRCSAMVGDSLDQDSKPKTGSGACQSACMQKWFRPWIPGDYTAPVYTAGGVRTDTLNHDTSFINRVIADTLTLSESADGNSWVFEHRDFTPLEDRGFDRTRGVHNSSFTMELHTDFVYLPGSQISFSSDDHLWVFIEGHLVFDNGSAHANPASSLSLDSLARARSIHPGQTCSFDLFYAQRNLSSPRLSFSIPRCKESHLTLQEQIAAQPSPSEYAFRLTADIYCDTTLLLSPGGYFFWGLVDQFSNPGRFLNSTFGDGSVEVGLPYTHASQGVWVLYWNTQTGTFLSDTITVTAPNPPYVDYHIRLSDGTVAPERVEIEKGVLCTLRAWAKNTETEEYEGPLPARWLIDNTGLDLEYSPEHVLIISPYDTGTSTVYITDTSKYIHSDPIEILVKQTATSLKASSHKLHEELFHITPTTATIHTPQEWQSCRIRIIKPNGAAVFDVTSQKHQVRLPIRQLPAGVYFVTVQNRAARKVHRLVIKE